MTRASHDTNMTQSVNWWPRLISLTVLAMLLLAGWVGLHQSLVEINANWSVYYSHFAHGYLVLAVAIWLGVRAWRSRPPLRLSPFWLSIPVLILLVGALLLSIRMQITTVNQSIVPLVVLAALAASFGMQIVRLLFWPVVYVYFALPLWWAINAPLQFLTIKVSMLAIRIWGIPAHVEDNMFELPAGVLQIASGCSGLNYLITGLAIAFLQGFLYLRSWSCRIRLLAFTAVLMMVMNWIRVITVIAVGYYTDMQHYFIRVDHLTFGWVLFLVALLPVYWFGFRLARTEEIPEAEAVLQRPPAALSIEPVQVVAGGVITSLILVMPAVLNM